jgi:hypothetical protein
MTDKYQLAGFILFGLVGAMDVQEEERQHAEYCEMVKLWKETNGQQGWPAYNGEDTCPKGNSNDWPPNYARPWLLEMGAEALRVRR